MGNPENKQADEAYLQVSDDDKHADYLVDATKLNCPLPLLKMKQALNSAQVGQTVKVSVTDPASHKDFASYISMTAHHMETSIQDGLFLYWITKNN